MSYPLTLEMVPLGESKSRGSKAPEAGKKSLLFSEQEQKAIADANSGANIAGGAGNVSKGKLRAGAQMVSTKLKGKNPRSVSRPNCGPDGKPRRPRVAEPIAELLGLSLPIADLLGMSNPLALEMVPLSKKQLPSPSRLREDVNEFNLKKGIASIAKRGTERRASVAAATPGRSGCQSSLGSLASAGAFVSATATTAVPDSPAPASATIASAVASIAATSPSAASDELFEGLEANGARSVGPTSRYFSPPSNQASDKSKRGDAGDKSGPEAGDMAITNERNLMAESMAAATASPPQTRAQVTAAMVSSRTKEVAPPLPPSLLIPMPSAGAPETSCVSEINPASTATAEEAPRVESSNECAPTHARELGGEIAPSVAATVVQDSRPSLMVAEGSVEAGCSSGDVGSIARNTHRLAVSDAGDAAPTDLVEDPKRTGREKEARKNNVKQAYHSMQEADGDQAKDEVDAGGVVDQEELRRGQERKDEGKGDRERCDEGEDEEQQEEEESEKGEGVASIGGVKRLRPSYPWYRQGTLVVLNCGPDGKPGRPRLSVPIADLLGRPVGTDLRSSDCRTVPS